MPTENKQTKLLTLVIIHQHTRVLLGMKKKGFGAGRWNGFGGKVESSETIEQAAIREVQEEAGITVGAIDKCGVITFEFVNEPDKQLEVHIFRATEFTGDPIETDEMKPQWFAVDEIPFKDMWVDDAYWMPLFLKGKRFRGRFLFDKPSTVDYQAKIIEHELKEA